METPYPLIFRPILKEKVWGGTRLARWNKTIAPGALVGESWELADLEATSASGGGGGAEHSVITNGALTGKTIREAVHMWGERLMGAGQRGVNAFPLLVKFLDAREHLSVQVHPSPEYAAAHPSAHLKTESWYVLAAEAVDGAPPVIFKGLQPGVGRGQLEAAIRDHRVPEVMRAWPAIAGELHHLPSGTVHALGAGVAVAEVQTPSDTTFRVYDWAKEYGRAGRELHITQALGCIDFGPPPEAVRLQPGQVSTRLVKTEFYSIHELRPSAGRQLELPAGPRPGWMVVMVVAGTADLYVDGQIVELQLGVTCLIPARLAAGAVIAGKAGTPATLLVAMP